MKKHLFLRAVCALVVPAAMSAGCSDNNEPYGGSEPDNEKANGKYVIAASVTDSKGTTNILLTAESLDEGQVSLGGNTGLLNDGASQWVFHPDNYLYALTYNQGNAGTTRSYRLNQDGTIAPRDMEYKISRFTSYGIYDNKIISTSTGNGASSQPMATAICPRLCLFRILMSKPNRRGRTTRRPVRIPLRIISATASM